MTDDDKVLEQFNELICYRDGRYQVAWPWKCQNPDLPINLDIVIERMKSLARHLKENADLLKKYDDIIQGQVQKGIIEKVTENMKESDRKHYLPHHPVITPTKRAIGKMRNYGILPRNSGCAFNSRKEFYCSNYRL